jgi:hypothetical protein
VINHANKFVKAALELINSSALLEDYPSLAACAANVYYRCATLKHQVPTAVRTGPTRHSPLRVLHGVLCAALAHTNRESGGGLAEARRLAGSRTFQDALLNCTVELVVFAASGEPSFPELTSRLGRLPLVLDLWDAAGCFGTHIRDQPAVLCGYVGLMRLRIAEELAWRNGSSVFTALSAGGGGACAQGDKALVAVRASACLVSGWAATHVFFSCNCGRACAGAAGSYCTAGQCACARGRRGAGGRRQRAGCRAVPGRLCASRRAAAGAAPGPALWPAPGAAGGVLRVRRRKVPGRGGLVPGARACCTTCRTEAGLHTVAVRAMMEQRSTCHQAGSPRDNARLHACLLTVC